MKKQTRKALCLVLSLALLVSSVTTTKWPQNAKAAETAQKIIVYVAAEGTGADGTTVTINKTPVLIETGSTADAAIQSVLENSYSGDYVISETDWGKSLDSIHGLGMYQADPNDANSWVYWSFMVNGEYGNGISNQKLKDQDQLSLIYTYNNTNNQCSCYNNNTSLAPDAAAQAKVLENAKAQQALLARKIYEINFAGGTYIPDIMDTDSIYSAYALLKSGFQAESFYTAIADKLTAQLEELKQVGSTASAATDAAVTLDYYEGNPYVTINYTKIALFLSAAGRDISNIGGINLIEKITDRDLYNISNPTTISRDSMILSAMNEAEAKWPDSENTLTVRELMDAILADVDHQIEQSIAWESYDSAAMVIQTLAPYANAPETNHIIQAETLRARDKVIELLSNIQDSSGAYISYSASNPWTLAQVMVTLGAYGIDPLTDQRFIKNGTTLYDISATFIDVEKETVDEQLIGGEWAYQPDQLLRGLTAALRVSAAQDPTASPSAKPSIAPSAKPSVTPSTSPNMKPSVTPKQKNDSTVTHLDKPVIKKVSSAKKKSLSVTFSKVKNAKKYVIQVSTDKKFKKKVRTKYVSSARKVTFKKLKSHQKYYVRIQAVRQKLESKWSKTKCKKVK